MAMAWRQSRQWLFPIRHPEGSRLMSIQICISPSVWYNHELKCLSLKETCLENWSQDISYRPQYRSIKHTCCQAAPGLRWLEMTHHWGINADGVLRCFPTSLKVQTSKRSEPRRPCFQGRDRLNSFFLAATEFLAYYLSSFGKPNLSYGAWRRHHWAWTASNSHSDLSIERSRRLHPLDSVLLKDVLLFWLRRQ